MAQAAFAYMAIAMAAASAVGKAISAQQEAKSLRSQAAFEEFNAGQEKIRGMQDANKIRENLLATLASNSARYAAAGIDLNSGTPETIDIATQEDADRQLELSRTNATILEQQRRMQAAQYRSGAKSTSMAGWIGLGTGIFAQAENAHNLYGGSPETGRPKALEGGALKGKL